MPNTNALNRVKNHKASGSGLRLSAAQLRKLADLLDADNAADGICFMVGKAVGSTERTVEMIPYKAETNGNKIFTNRNGIVGAINYNLGKETPQSTFEVVVSNDGVVANPPFGQMPAGVMAFGVTGNSQKTPPPFIP